MIFNLSSQATQSSPSLRAAKPRGNLFLKIIIILILTFNFSPSQAAIEFDGVDDYINIGSNIQNQIALTDKITITAWISFQVPRVFMIG